MRFYRILATALVLTGLGVSEVSAHDRYEETLLQGWYRKYLRRPLDPLGAAIWTGELRGGVPAEVVLAKILGSAEYFGVQGATSYGFVKGLYADVLGRAPSEREIHDWESRLEHYDDRIRLANDFLFAAQAPPPVTSGYRPAHSSGLGDEHSRRLRPGKVNVDWGFGGRGR